MFSRIHFFYYLLLVFLVNSNLNAQKPILDTSALNNWPAIGEFSVSISDDGSHVLYAVDSKNGGLFLWSRGNGNSQKIPGAVIGDFAANDRKLVFLTRDSLGLLELGSRQRENIAHALSFKVPEEGDRRWVAYLLANQEMVLYDLLSGEKKIYPKVINYTFSKSGKILLLQATVDSTSSGKITIEWLDLITNKVINIWSGTGIGNLTFNKQEDQIAFIAKNNNQESETNKIWYYKTGMDSAAILVDAHTSGMENGFIIADNALQFSPDSRQVFFSLHRTPNLEKQERETVAVDVWNYQDDFLQPAQLDREAFINQPFQAVVEVEKQHVLQLEQKRDGLFWGRKLNEGGGYNFFLTAINSDTATSYWLAKKKPDIYLVNTHNGEKTCIFKQFQGWDEMQGWEINFSIGGKYLWWYDRKKKAYFTYSIADRITRNISSKIPFSLYDELWDGPAFPYPYGAAFWLKNDGALFVYDRYDIWQLDPEGKTLPINITHGYGRKNKIVLRNVYKQGRWYSVQEPPVTYNDTLLLCGFNEINKYNGFYKQELAGQRGPVELIMSPKVFYFSANFSGVDFSRWILKAKKADHYVLFSMSTTEYPNIQVTADFKNFEAVSDLQPQKEYNWLTCELRRWKTFSGKDGEGLLYKPENFDPSIKYPVILYFYERLSAGLNKFPQPGLSTGRINIPWFVSHGYLVFCPDIHYKVGDPGTGIYDYVVSAAEMLKRLPWVEGKHMAIQGHSFGGFEVNYLITRTNMFAAAAEAAGQSDMVSGAGSGAFGVTAGHSFTELGSYRMGVSIWQNPQAYIRNSPVFNADKISTPLLMMHNKKDSNVPWLQAVELFTALRRLGKQCWMLQYDGEDHITYSSNPRLDYTVRLEQFFDHFLKGKPAPKWMTDGVPVYLKGIERGLELTR